MVQSIVRTDRWFLKPSRQTTEHLAATVTQYRAFCKALTYVVYGHWVEIKSAKSQCVAVERLIHKTKSNPSPKYQYFGKRFYKFPSYLRRAAIEFVCGQVSSFVTRYQEWQSGIRKKRDARPPKLNPEAGCYPALYRGQCILFGNDLEAVQIKVWNGSDWVWSEPTTIKTKRDRHLLSHSKTLSPYLMVNHKGVYLSVPFGLKPEKLKGDRVCAVDVGINTLATASIVGSDGTVTARKFLHPAADIDHRDRLFKRISRMARLTKKLHKGFCNSLYRKARHINQNLAQQVSRQIVNFARGNGASVIVFEQLKNWKPKGGRKRSTLKQKFHGWLHRKLVELVEQKFEEVGGITEYVYPRGTSSWAYDGSGQVSRDKSNYSNATFKTGKQYNCDLSASYNIAARYWAYKLKLTRRKDGRLLDGKSSSNKQRMPVTLSLLWEPRSSIVVD
ncbi:MAG TPA: transposase [Cyanobacteria bacterium UBA8553]|nr:transposase [Cyanobacteria bacterium UBA8553]